MAILAPDGFGIRCHRVGTGEVSVRSTAHMFRVKSLPCVLCSRLGREQTSVTDAHHFTVGRAKGTKNDDMLTLALCHDDCHQGSQGIHGDRTLLRIAKVDEQDLLADTLRSLYA